MAGPPPEFAMMSPFAPFDSDGYRSLPPSQTTSSNVHHHLDREGNVWTGHLVQSGIVLREDPKKSKNRRIFREHPSDSRRLDEACFPALSAIRRGICEAECCVSIFSYEVAAYIRRTGHGRREVRTGSAHSHRHDSKWHFPTSTGSPHLPSGVNCPLSEAQGGIQ
jgi:hypothetical protein